MKQVEKYKNTTIGSRVTILKLIAQQLSSKSKKWESLFSNAQIDGINDWQIVELLNLKQAGTSLNEQYFCFARVAKLLAVTEEWNVNETLTTKQDLVNWNRHAILAMIEVVKQGEFEKDKLTRAYAAIELINKLFPEYFFEDH
jgi:hypothetical protein